jgi:putative PIN family toxin of toxin-antitoxin system
MMPPVVSFDVRIVLDTAALISALRSETGAAAEIVRLALQGDLELLLDYKLVCEYRDVALRTEHLAVSRKTGSEVEEVIRALEAIAIGVNVTIRYRPLSRDADDDMVLDVAINGPTDVIVTSNLRDFADAAAEFGIRVLTPKMFLVEHRRGRRPHADRTKKEPHQ